MTDLEKQGIDLSNPEELKKEILEDMKVSYGVERKYRKVIHILIALRILLIQ